MANPRGKNYWSIVLRFPHPDIVLETKEADIIDFLKGLSGIGKKRANDITQSLIRLAKPSGQKEQCSCPWPQNGN